MNRLPPRLACRKSTKAVEKAAVLSPRQSAEQVCFPLAEQAALLLRQTEGGKDELVALITSVEPSRLDAANWMRLNRDAWGIENGLHQRLDISHNDDRCRVRHNNAMLVLAMMLRLSNSLFMQWSGYKRRPDHVTTTDFQSALSEDHHRPAHRIERGGLLPHPVVQIGPHAEPRRPDPQGREVCGRAEREGLAPRDGEFQAQGRCYR